MNLEFDRLRNFLYERRNTDIFENPYDLYKAFILVEKDGKQTKFDQNNQELLFCEGLYRYHKKYGIQSLVNVPLPYKIDPDMHFSDFCQKLTGYANTPYLEDNLYHKLIEKMKDMMGHDPDKGWTKVYSSRLEKDAGHEKETRRIYLSVDNKDLHEFALRLLVKCDELGIRYEFKINADDSYRRADNVVIYTSDEDFPKYITAIEEIKKDNPNIDFGSANMLAYPFNEYIGVVSKEEDGKGGSHSEIICDEICCLRNHDNLEFDSFYADVEKFMLQELDDTIQFCDQCRRKMNESRVMQEDSEGITLPKKSK